jgi:hypothetical protein
MSLYSSILHGMTLSVKGQSKDSNELRKQALVLHELLKLQGGDNRSSLRALRADAKAHVESVMSEADDLRRAYDRASPQELLRRRDEFQKLFRETAEDLRAAAEQLGLPEDKVRDVRERVGKRMEARFQRETKSEAQRLVRELEQALDRDDQADVERAAALLSNMNGDAAVREITRVALKEIKKREEQARRDAMPWQTGGIEKLRALGVQRVELGGAAVRLERHAQDLKNGQVVVTLPDGTEVQLPISPVRDVTVHGLTRKALKVPDNAKQFGFTYPAARSVLDSLGASALAFKEWFELGSYVYFGGADGNEVMAVNAIVPNKGLRYIRFKGPFRVSSAAHDALHKAGRWHPVTLPALRDKGAKEFCWIFPGEPLEGSEPAERLQWKNGAFAYCYDEAHRHGKHRGNPSEERDNCFTVDDIDDLVDEKAIRHVDDEAEVRLSVSPAGKQDSAAFKKNKGLIAPYEGAVAGEAEGKGWDEDEGTAAPNRKLRRDIVLFKGLVCGVLFSLVLLMAYVAIGRDLVPAASQFCSVGATGVRDNAFCSLKVSAVIMSMLLLAPEVAMMGAQVSLLFTPLLNEEEQAKAVRVRHKTLGAVKEFSLDFLLGFQALFLPAIMVALVPKFGNGWEFISLWLEALLTWSIFPLSYYVIGSSTNPADIVINVVAVQFFASVDENLIKFVFRLRQSAKGTRDLYYDIEDP